MGTSTITCSNNPVTSRGNLNIDSKKPSRDSRDNQSPINSHPLLQLQQAAGNQAVQSLFRLHKIQTKLSISNPSDIYELEADRVAEQVMRMSEPSVAVAPFVTNRSINHERRVDRKCRSCEDEEEELKINRKSLANVDDNLHMKENASREIEGIRNDAGSPIDSSTRAFMQSRFGYDFNDVKIHTNDRAARSAKSLNALAYTIGNNIIFDYGKYDPSTIVGKRLLAHELTHVLQQTGAQIVNQSKISEISESIQLQTAGSNSDSDPSHSSPPIIEISVETANGMTENDIIILIVAMRRQIQQTEKGSTDSQILERNLATLRSSLSKRCGESNSGLKNKIKKPDLIMRIGENSVVAVRAADVIYAAKTGSGPMSREPEASVQEPLTCEKIDQQAINSTFEAMGSPAGEDILVHPGDNMYILAEVTLMNQEGVPFETARDYAFLQLGIKTEDKEKTATQPAEPSTGGDVVSVAAVGGALATSKGAEPQMLEEGKICHCAVGRTYAGLNPPTYLDKSIAYIVGLLKLTKTFYDKLYNRLPDEIVEVLAIRPDILDAGKLQIYEIKSLKSGGRALGEALLYIKILEDMKIPGLELSLGSPSNPGANGWLVAGSGWCVWISPVPGVIIYRYILRPENPRRAQERLRNEVEGAPQIGVETATAAVILGALAGEAVAIEVKGYKELIDLIIKGATAAGRALEGPRLAPVTP